MLLKHARSPELKVEESPSNASRSRSGLESSLLDAGFLEGPLTSSARPAEARSAEPGEPGQAPGRAAETTGAEWPISAVVGSALAPLGVSREITHVLGALAPSLAARTCVAIHVTAAAPGAGVSTVARELASTATTLVNSRTLLLSMSADASGLGFAAGTLLPDVVTTRLSHGKPSVMAIKTTAGCFHAACCVSGPMPEAVSPENRPRPVAEVCAILQRSYDLIIVDCNPLTGLPAFLPIVPGSPKVLLVVAAGRTRNSEAVRARNLIELRGGVLIGAVLYGGRGDS